VGNFGFHSSDGAPNSYQHVIATQPVLMPKGLSYQALKKIAPHGLLDRALSHDDSQARKRIVISRCMDGKALASRDRFRS
jgi:hypothetical protein